jgi:hypothetical protein
MLLLVSTWIASGHAQTQAPAGSTNKGTGSTAAKQKARAHSKKTAPPTEVQQAPPPPPTLEQQPPTPPQVTYRDGQLTISSANATLSQILRSVQVQTGATVEIPPGAGSERVVANLGPGKPQSVLASLLNGSRFNYVLLGDANKPGAVQKVILLAKTGGSSTGPEPQTTAQSNFRQPQPQQAVEPPEDEYPQNEPVVENDAQQLQPGQPGMPGAENLTPDQVNGSKTPEQLLQELQRMQQQQQQMQQQLNPANQQQPNQQLQVPPQANPFPNPPQPR